MDELILLPLQRTFVCNRRTAGRPERNCMYAGIDSYGSRYRMLMRFDMSMLPENAHIVSAAVKACGAISNRHEPGFFRPYAIVSPWSQRVTWETQPAIDARLTGNTVEIDRNGWYSWDVTGIAQAWGQKRLPNNGLMIKSTENAPDIACFEIFLSHHPDCYSPALYVKFDCSEPWPCHKKTENHFEIVRAGEEPAYTTWQNTSSFKMYTYLVQNTGPDTARIGVQISPDQIVQIGEEASREILSGQTAAIVPQKYAFYTRLAIEPSVPGGNCALKIWFQAQE